MTLLKGRQPVPSTSTRLTRVVTVRMSVECHNALLAERERTKQSINTIILKALSSLQEKNRC